MPIAHMLWQDGALQILDQTRLPAEEVWLEVDAIPDLVEAIQKLRVRGAPAIGIAAALGVAMAAHQYTGPDEAFVPTLHEAIQVLAATRPTAVNLFWALERMKAVLNEGAVADPDLLRVRLKDEALAILAEDRVTCRTLGRHGAALLPSECTLLTHCNAGALATADYGTALGVVYAAVEAGKRVRVFVDETRPLLQGARLTAWELQKAGIDVTVLPDSAAGTLLASGVIDAVLVGADRIAANGDTANKIGTYPLAVLARRHEVPFYVAAPVSTLDLSLPTGQEIPIEQRPGEEVALSLGRRTVPEGVAVYNPAFDITPAELITAIVTERGVVRPPFHGGLTTVTSRASD